jgi:hypothetical protein
MLEWPTVAQPMCGNKLGAWATNRVSQREHWGIAPDWVTSPTARASGDYPCRDGRAATDVINGRPCGFPIKLPVRGRESCATVGWARRWRCALPFPSGRPVPAPRCPRAGPTCGNGWRNSMGWSGPRAAGPRCTWCGPSSTDSPGSIGCGTRTRSPPETCPAGFCRPGRPGGQHGATTRRWRFMTRTGFIPRRPAAMRRHSRSSPGFPGAHRSACPLRPRSTPPRPSASSGQRRRRSRAQRLRSAGRPLSEPRRY